MTSAKSPLLLFYEDEVIGCLSENSQHMVDFVYDPNWLRSAKKFSISYSMPLREEPYGREAQNYFANLLPEGEVRTAIAGRLGISQENDFRLLEALGGECAGALTIGHVPQPQEARYQVLSPKKLKEIFEQGGTVFSVVQEEERGIRLSLAGAQDKIPVLYQEGKIHLPQGNSPSSHILKFPSKRFKHLPENECLMGIFAKKMGLETASPVLVELEGMRAYLVERYDRQQVGNRIRRLHQEDYCQALAYSYKAKYENDGGPDFEECYQCTEARSSHLPEDLERLAQWLIFNVLVGNCDAHAKNISLLMEAPEVWKLSPHYDLVSTKVYPKLTKKLSMSIGGAVDSGTVTGSHWAALAKDIKVGTKWLHTLVREMAEKAPEAFAEARQEFVVFYGSSPVLATAEKVIQAQQRRVLSELGK